MLSISAFTAVMLLLGILSAAIWLLTVAFAPPSPAAVPGIAQGAPPAAGDADAPTLAALHAAVQRLLPGGRITHVSALPGPAERGEEAR
jgi:hypothetical protein